MGVDRCARPKLVDLAVFFFASALTRVLRQDDRQTCEMRMVSNSTWVVLGDVGLPLPLSLRKSTDNIWKLVYI